MFIGNIYNLYAVDGQTGKLKWSFGTGGEVQSTPAIAIDGTIYVTIDIGGISGYLFAIDGQSGHLKWKYLLNNYCGPLSPAIGSDGTVYICAGSLYAFDGQTGVLKYYSSKCSGCDASPIVGADGTVYVFTFPNRSIALVCALQGQTGQVEWATPVGCYSPMSSLALGDGIVIVGCDLILALDMKSGRVRWDTGVLVWAYSVAAIGLDGTIYIGGEYIYALDGQTGVVRWKFENSGASSWNVPAIGADGTVYVGGKNTALALDGQTGSLYGMIPLNGQPTSAAIGIDGTIYFGVGNGLVAINCA